MLSKLLISVAKQHKDRMADHLRTMGLYVGQDIFLMTLARHGECTQTELKDLLKVEYPTIHKIAVRLEKRGLIVRTKDPADLRVSLLSLTNEGKKVTKKIERFWKEIEKEFFASLEENEKRELQKLLGKLK